MGNINKKNNSIAQSLLPTARVIFTDISEISLDEAIQRIQDHSELIKKIPVIKWILVGNDVRSVIQKAFFIKKYGSFIGQISAGYGNSAKDIKNLEDVLSSEKKISQLLDCTILAIDRFQTQSKAKLLGELFVQTFKFNNFSIDEYNKLIFSIENMNSFDGIKVLYDFYKYKIEITEAIDQKEKDLIWQRYCNLDYSSLANTGLLILPKGGAYAGDLGGAMINELGYKFYEKVAMNLDQERY